MNMYFGDKGLTTTSANYIANKAKEMYKVIEARLQGANYYNEDASIVGSKDFTPTLIGVKDEFLTKIPSALKQISDLKALIAWLREAIKEKNRLFEEAQNLESEDLNNLHIPRREPNLTEQEVIASWTPDKRQRYLTIEARASTFGSYVHSDSTGMSLSRKRLSEVLQEPTIVNGSGRDTIIRRRTPSVASELVEKVFFDLQTTWRSFESELNALKHEIDETIKTDSINKRNAYERALAEYHCKCSTLTAELTKLREDKCAEIGAYKIIIPEGLIKIYETVNNLGK